MKKTHDYVHRYRGYWSNGGSCRIRIYRGESELPVVVCSQLPDNTNTSVTNMAEYLAAEVVEEHSLPTPLVWVEHYPENRGARRGVVAGYVLVLGGRGGLLGWGAAPSRGIAAVVPPRPRRGRGADGRWAGGCQAQPGHCGWALTMKEEERLVLTTDEVYDVVIIGSGAAGYAAAVQAAWAGLSTLVLQSFEAGGQLMLSDRVENYPGLGEDTTGPDLADAMEEQAIRLGAEVRLVGVVRADLSGRPFELWAEGEDESYLARSVIVATGAVPRWLSVEGEQRLFGRGVSGCATCDGFFFRDKKVAVVGGGDRAMEEALVLARYAREVVVVHRRSRFRASGTLLRRAQEEPKISFLTETLVEEVLGGHSMEGLRMRDARTGEGRVLDVDGLFVAVGYEPHLGPFAGLLDTDGRGYVVLNENTMTSVPGAFAAGEAADGRYRQTATAVGSGCRAAVDAQRWLEEQGGTGGLRGT